MCTVVSFVNFFCKKRNRELWISLWLERIHVSYLRWCNFTSIGEARHMNLITVEDTIVEHFILSISGTT